MDVSTLTLKLIMLLFPGLVAGFIYKRLTIKHQTRSDFMFVLLVIMLGVLSYLMIQVLLSGYICLTNLFGKHKPYEVLSTFKDISNSNIIPFEEIIFASLAAIIVSIVTVKISHQNLINKWAFRWGISNKYGDENLYSNFLNENCVEWVYVRDIVNKLTYMGCVQCFAEAEEFKELVLKNVSVFTYPESDELYQVDKIYLCFPKDRIIIEQAIIQTEENHEETRNQNPNPEVAGQERAD